MTLSAKHYRPKFLEGKILSSDSLTPRKCRMCPQILPPYLRYYCCYKCKEAAQLDGSYGREDELPPPAKAEREFT